MSENEALVNRIHVPDHKYEFLFGQSRKGPLAEGAAALQHDMEQYGREVWAAWWEQAQEQAQAARAEAAQVEAAQQGAEQPEVEQAAVPVVANGSAAGKAARQEPEEAAACGEGWGGAGGSSACPSAPRSPSPCSSPPKAPAPPRMQLVLVGHG